MADHFHRRRRVRRDKLIITLSSRLISNIILRGRCDLAESRVSARGAAWLRCCAGCIPTPLALLDFYPLQGIPFFTPLARISRRCAAAGVRSSLILFWSLFVSSNSLLAVFAGTACPSPMHVSTDAASRALAPKY